jgi:hypothetical protein
MNIRLFGSLFLLAAVLSASGARTALAQGAMSKIGPQIGGEGIQRPAKAPLPPALPGAQLNRDRSSPAEKPALDVSPNEALFDAINRGDIAGARDAVNRGADVGARNVLGMTPLDLSIDLSRNDITFLLLSLRPAANEPPAAPVAQAKPGARPAAAPLAAPAATQARPSVASAPKPETSVAIPARAPVRPATPPGTPNPQAGFLGFGG